MIEKIKQAAREAGYMMMKAHDFNVHSKGSAANYVSDIDIAVEKFLRQRLGEICPDADFMGEESDFTNSGKDKVWIVDPIDGTANFVRGMNMSAVSIALSDNDGILYGVVYDPYIDRMFYAHRGHGAYMNGEKIHVSDRDTEHSIISIAMSVYKKEYAPPCFKLAERIMMQCEDIRRVGSAAIELCNLAAGKIEMFFEARLYPWDYAAASLFITEAGGYISSMDKELSFNSVISIIAANTKENFKLIKDEALECFDGIEII